MGRAPCCSGEHAGLKKGPWSHEEDMKLKSFLLNNPTTSWRLVPQKAGLVRCGKSCRLRWMNYLRPDIRRGNFTQEEEDTIVQLHEAVGNRWSIIAAHLPGRTDNEIKNLWNTKLRKALVLKGINPITHQTFCTPQLSDHVKNWIKSLENALITGFSSTHKQQPPNPTGTSIDIDLTNLPWASLPPLPPPPPTRSDSLVGTQTSSGATATDCSMQSLPVVIGEESLLACNMEELGQNMTDPFLLADMGLFDPVGAAGLEEAWRTYWE